MKKRDFLTLSDFTVDEALGLLKRAGELKKGIPGPAGPRPLEGRCVGMLFEKASTRTRVSFEVGIRQLGGDAFFLGWRDIQIGRGEPIKDTARVLSRYLDGLVLRTFAHSDVEEFARWASIPVINGLTDLLHPCQLLSDLFTAQEAGLDVRTMRAAWIGDGNNMANSWIVAAKLLGFHLALACPEGYDPAVPIDSDAVSLTRDPREAIRGAEIVSTDVWASMGHEAEQEERRKALAGYQVNRELLEVSGVNTYVLHCLPAHRGEEITDDVLESDRSLIWDQSENRLHAQKAVLEMLTA